MVDGMVRSVAAAGLALAAAACTSAPSRFYTLRSTATGTAAAHASYSVSVGPVSVPAAVDRPQLVVEVSPNRVELDEFNRWAAPLDDAIARTVANDLASLLGTPRVAAAPLANFAPAYRVTIDVLRFESAPGESVLVDALWVVQATASGMQRSGRTIAPEPVTDEGYDALAAAHSRALARVSADVAVALRDLDEESLRDPAPPRAPASP